MILEIIGGTAMSGLLTWTFLDKQGVSEAAKIQRIANNCGLLVKENGKTHTIHLHRKTRHAWGTEYAYRIPLGLSFEDFQKKQKHIEDGLNHKRGLLDLTLDDLKTLRLNRDILVQIKELLSEEKHRKEILMDYDGMLIIRVYKEPMPEMIPFNDDTLKGCKGWNVCMGDSREGMVYHDFDRIPHMVGAGTTTYGKSVFLKNVVTTLIHNQPNAVNFTLIDLKGGLAFNRFANAKQVRTVASDPVEALEALNAIQEEMKNRQHEFRVKGFENIREAKMKRRDFIIIDEAAELAPDGEQHREQKKIKQECLKAISEIARIGGSLGYRLIFTTQYPTADTLPRQVKQNCDARLCFRIQTDIASRVVLDEAGAEKLPFGIKGRAIYQTDRKHIVQTPYIENQFIDKTIKPHIVLKARKEEQHEKKTRQQDAPRGEHTLIIEES